MVLDLGSGGGIDVLLSARRVGPSGKAYGLDMTDEMLALARRNLAESGLTNVEFLKGEIEAIPLPDSSVDVIISNCVINLSADKDRVLREAFRVLRPGGRFAVSDVVVRGAVPPEIRKSVELWVGCVAAGSVGSVVVAAGGVAGVEAAGVVVVPSRGNVLNHQYAPARITAIAMTCSNIIINRRPRLGRSTTSSSGGGASSIRSRSRRGASGEGVARVKGGGGATATGSLTGARSCNGARSLKVARSFVA